MAHTVILSDGRPRVPSVLMCDALSDGQLSLELWQLIGDAGYQILLQVCRLQQRQHCTHLALCAVVPHAPGAALTDIHRYIS